MGNREELMQAAKRCLNERGYSQTSARDIASEAGVSTAAIGYHYGTKDALLMEALLEALAEWGAVLGKKLVAPTAPGTTAGTGSGRTGSASSRPSPPTGRCGGSSSTCSAPWTATRG